MKSIEIYRGTSELVTIRPDDSSTQVKKIMSDNVCTISFEDSRFIPFEINDWCTIFGEVYKLNTIPVCDKLSKYYYKYTLTMQSEAYDLTKAQYLFLGADNTLRETDFSYMGTASDYLDLLLMNMARIDTGWTKGEVILTTYKALTFSKVNCYNALSTIAEAFGTEFWIGGKKISMTKVQTDQGREVKHGRNMGLTEIIRKNQDSSNIATRLYAFGADKNLPPLYGNTRLMLPTIATNGGGQYLVQNVDWAVVNNGTTETITFTFPALIGTNITALNINYSSPGMNGNSTAGFASPRSVELPLSDYYDIKFTTYLLDGTSYTTEVFRVTTGTGTALKVAAPRMPYLERNTDKYGFIEHTEVFDDIYPHRTGKVTSVDATNIYKFIDSTIDFDINGYLLPGTAAKVTFNTGQLAGYTFNISKYDHATKTVTFLKNSDETAFDVPSDTYKPQIGDEYVFVDIYMPESYVMAAEEALLAKANMFLEAASIPQVAFQVVFDPTFLRRKAYAPAIGDLLWLKDEYFNIDRKIRITSTTRNIVNEWDFSVELADKIDFGRFERTVNTGNVNSQDISDIQRYLASAGALNGRLILPEITSTTGYSAVYVNDTTGQLARKV